jgi:hypothetical protein
LFYLQTVSTKIFEEQKSYSKPYIIIATDFKINIHKTDNSHYGSEIFNHMTNIHHLIGSPVTCMNARSSPSQLAVGLGSCGGANKLSCKCASKNTAYFIFEQQSTKKLHFCTDN